MNARVAEGGIYLVRSYGSSSARGRDVRHSGFILYPEYSVGGNVVVLRTYAFEDLTMPEILTRARTRLEVGELDEVTVYEAREDVTIYDGEV